MNLLAVIFSSGATIVTSHSHSGRMPLPLAITFMLCMLCLLAAMVAPIAIVAIGKLCGQKVYFLNDRSFNLSMGFIMASLVIMVVGMLVCVIP